MKLYVSTLALRNSIIKQVALVLGQLITNLHVFYISKTAVLKFNFNKSRELTFRINPVREKEAQFSNVDGKIMLKLYFFWIQNTKYRFTCTYGDVAERHCVIELVIVRAGAIFVGFRIVIHFEIFLTPTGYFLLLKRTGRFCISDFLSVFQKNTVINEICVWFIMKWKPSGKTARQIWITWRHLSSDWSS